MDLASTHVLQDSKCVKLSATSCFPKHPWEISAALQQVETSVMDQDPSVPGFAEVRLSQRVSRRWHCRCCCNTEIDGSGTDFSSWNLPELTPKDLVGSWTALGIVDM